MTWYKRLTCHLYNIYIYIYHIYIKQKRIYIYIYMTVSRNPHTKGCQKIFWDPRAWPTPPMSWRNVTKMGSRTSWERCGIRNLFGDLWFWQRCRIFHKLTIAKTHCSNTDPINNTLQNKCRFCECSIKSKKDLIINNS